jgi:hypothetical protein
MNAVLIIHCVADADGHHGDADDVGDDDDPPDYLNRACASG